jgi:hypothetical protein
MQHELSRRTDVGRAVNMTQPALLAFNEVWTAAHQAQQD